MASTADIEAETSKPFFILFVCLGNICRSPSNSEVYVDGSTTMSIHERKASIREFYAVIYPSFVQLERGVNDSEDTQQHRTMSMERYCRRRDETENRPCLKEKKNVVFVWR